MVCHGSTGITYSVQPIANATTYTWSLPAGITFSPGSSNNSNTISVDVSPAFTGGAISVFGDNNGCTGSSSTLQIAAGQLTAITQQPASVSSVVRGSATFTVAAAGPVESYQWRKNQVDIPGATSVYYTVSGVQHSDVGSYDVIVTKAGACPATSAPAQLSIKTLADQTDRNWILSRNILVPNVRMEGDIENLPVEGVVESIAYFDGLGRPIQKVAIHGSPAKMDIVQPIVYDNFNREARKYLPFTTESDGYYKPNIIDAAGNYTGIASSFYSNNANGKIAQDARPFSETIFEPSPLNRPLKDFGPGEDWHDNNKFIEHGYTANVDGTEKIIAWTVNASGMPERDAAVTGTASGAGYYPTGALFVKRTIDEAGHEVREYTDKQGRVILKKVYASGGMTDLDNHNNWAQTYYIYDDFGNLRFVLQPQLVKDKIAGSTTYNPDATDLAHFAFQYKYDARRRMIEKQVPGAGVVYMIYDKRDRLVMTQDGNQRVKIPREWTFNKYDVFNRPVLTGIYKDALNREQNIMQQDVDAFYNGAAQETFYEEAGSAVHGYTNRSFPGVSSESDYLTVTYYDNYNVSNTWPGYNYLSEALTHTASGITYTQPAAAFNRVKGQVTATKVKVLDGGNSWLKTVSYYDDKYRVIQLVSDNHKGGTERVSNLYDFSGKILKTRTTHAVNSAANSISRRFVYDHAGRLLKLYHRVRPDAATQESVQWTNLAEVSINGNTITKDTPGSSWGNSGAFSVNAIPANTDGWVEFSVTNNLTIALLGLSASDANASYNTIDYAIHPEYNSRLYIYEAGTNRGQISTYVAGDVFRIERIEGVIYYKKNGELIYTSQTPFNGVLHADCAFYNSTGALSNVVMAKSMGSEVLLASNEYNELGQLITKKLHSTGNSNAFKQLCDYRYNIRGWLTRMNNSDLSKENNNDAAEPRDYFGMNLVYEAPVASLGNTPQYNGNISAMKWSTNLGLGNPAFGQPNERAYAYSYDPMNRLTSASHLKNTGGWNASAEFHENNLAYDLNGNILSLDRTSVNGSVMDVLTYDYGTGSARSNRLLAVTDGGNVTEGFKDGNTTGNDYDYDDNGNMTVDNNKDIDAIEYNHLNLPSRVTKGTGEYIRYIYDATGRKLRQEVYGNNNDLKKASDYLGEFFYENDTLKFINHEEGRVVTEGGTNYSANRIANGDAENLGGYSGAGAPVTLTNETINGESYVKVVTTQLGSTPGLRLGSFIPVNPGSHYTLRVKGYKVSSAGNAYLWVDGIWNGILVWMNPQAQLPNGAGNEDWVSVNFTVPAGFTQIDIGVLFGGGTFSVGDAIYINKVELLEYEESPVELEYQYHLKDHLGNVRLTFTTKEETDEATATLEASRADTEQSQFLNYNGARKINTRLFDHTNEGPTFNSVRLMGGNTTEVYGLAKSLSVMPGDTLNIEVYAKYLDPNPGNWSADLANIIAAIAGTTGTAGTYTDGGPVGSPDEPFPYPGLLTRENDNGTGPKAYLNYLIFDRNFNFRDGGYRRLSTNARESGQGADPMEGIAHERLFFENILIREPGYVYIYLSNENESFVEVFFDDFTVEHKKSPVVQGDDYYPFGLTFNSYQRENTTPNPYLYNGKEKQDELGLDWLDYGARMYMPEIGRWGVVDPLADMMFNQTPYGYAFNNPIKFIDLFGLAPGFPDDEGDDIRPYGRSQIPMEEPFDHDFNPGKIIDLPNSKFHREPGMAKCSTCPEGKEYDDYRNASHEFIYDKETGVVYNSTGGFECFACVNPPTQDEFFDVAGKTDVFVNSVVGVSSEAVGITLKQIADSKYYTQATKNTTLAVAKNLRRIGYVGIGVGTAISAYELSLNPSKASSWVRFGTGLVITGVAFIPYVGLPASIILGSYEAAGGFDSWYESFDKPRVINGFTKETMHDLRYPINKR